MNVSEDSVQKWLIVKYQNNHTVGNTTISNVTHSVIGSTEQRESDQIIWDIRWFGLLSAPLLFVTIILPLILGPSVRKVCHNYVRLRVYWRVGLITLFAVYFVLMYVFYFRKAFRYGITMMSICFLMNMGFVSFQFITAQKWKKMVLFFIIAIIFAFTTALGVSYGPLIILPIAVGVFSFVTFVLFFGKIFQKIDLKTSQKCKNCDGLIDKKFLRLLND